LRTDNLNVRVRSHRRQGTTLVEILVSLVFLGLASGALLGVITLSHTRAGNNVDKLIALTLAEDAVDELRRLAKDNPMVLGTTTEALTGTGITGTVTRTTTITANAGYGTLYTISVTVTWQHPTMSERSGSITLATKVVAPDA
jgi:type II secretory pathway pseudopilin PulG